MRIRDLWAEPEGPVNKYPWANYDADAYETLKNSLDVAVDENGYPELEDYTPHQLAEDTVLLDAVFEECDEKKLVPLCERWLNYRKEKKNG